MDYVVIDLEWNQPVNDAEIVTDPVYLEGEVIQIGAVKLNEKFETVDEYRCFIRPQYYATLNHTVARLTGIHNADVGTALDFPAACREFLAWCGDDFGFVSWGPDDVPMLLDNMLLHGIDPGEIPPVYDAQRIFGREIMRDIRQCSLEKAIDVLGESLDRSHDALNDCRNTVRVMNHLDLEEYMEEYRMDLRLFRESRACEAMRTRLYPGKGSVHDDPDISTFVCPYCGTTAKISGWLRRNKETELASAKCEEGDEFYVILTTLRNEAGMLHASRLIFDMTDDLWELYTDLRDGV